MLIMDQIFHHIDSPKLLAACLIWDQQDKLKCTTIFDHLCHKNVSKYTKIYQKLIWYCFSRHLFPFFSHVITFQRRSIIFSYLIEKECQITARFMRIVYVQYVLCLLFLSSSHILYCCKHRMWYIILIFHLQSSSTTV